MHLPRNVGLTNGRACTALLAFSLGLSACGVKLTAQHVDDANSTIPGEGIVYALPKTEFEVVQPAKITVSKSGAFSGIAESCRRACDATIGAWDPKDESCNFDTAAQVVLAPAFLRPLTVPDRGRLYQVNPGADLFQSLDLKFDVASSGVIEQADAGSTNLSYEFIGSLAEAAIQLYMRASGPVKQGVQNSQADSTRGCYPVSTEAATLVKKGSGRLHCPLLKEIEDCLEPFEADVEQERAELQALFKRGESQDWNSRVLLALVANQRDQIAAAQSRYDEAAGLYAMHDGPDRSATFEVAVPIGGPKEFTDYKTSRTLGEALTSGSGRLIGTSEEAASLRAPMAEALRVETRTYVLEIAAPKTVKTVQGGSGLGKGLHYRVPVLATTTLTIHADKVAGAAMVGLPVVEQRSVAQFGAIASLPWHFKGKGGRVLVKHWPDSGGLQHVEIGAEPMPTQTVTSLVDSAVEVRKAKKAADDAADAAAQARDPEIESLTRQLELLQLRRDIRAIEVELDDAQ